MRSLARFLSHPLPWGFAVLVWAVVLFFLSERNHVPIGPEIPHMDKVLHATYFMLGSACLVLWGRFREGRFTGAWVVIPLIFAALVGALDEWHQSFVPGRSGNDVGDWLADVTGGVLGLLLGRLIHRWLRRLTTAKR